MPQRLWQWPLGVRLAVIVSALVLEREGLNRLPHPWLRLDLSPHLLISVFLLAGILLALCYRRWRECDLRPVRPMYLLLHVGAMVMVLGSMRVLDGASVAGHAVFSLFEILWLAGLLLLPITLCVAVMRGREWMELARRTGRVWIFSGVLWLGMLLGYRSLQNLTWDAPSRLSQAIQLTTYNGVTWLLGYFYPHLVMDVPTRVIGTERFQVIVSSSCSGIEGVVLVLLLTLSWIVYRRRELRVGRALLLAAAATCIVWILNLIRIALLIAIGDAGYPDMAVHGFHSEAGWIAYNGVSIVFLVLAERTQWLRRSSAPKLEASDGNPTAVYLGPLLAVLVAGMLSHAFSSGFEALYPFRLLAAGMVLWCFRKEYRKLDWSSGWMGVLAGFAVGLAWIGVYMFLIRHGSGVGSRGDAIANGLAHWSPPARGGWIAARLLTATVVVPIAEELAFRGYLARRLMSREFETASYRQYSWMAIGVSSLIFGLMHGRMWAAGMASGVVFALLAKRRNSLGDAVVAHAAANWMLGVWVLMSGQYGLW